MTENELSNRVIGIAIELHESIGPRLQGSAYENVFAYDLRQAGFDIKQQVPMPFIYKEVRLDVGYRIDISIWPVNYLNNKYIES